MPQPKPINPFYVALLPVGAVFAITACAYGMMMVRGLDPHRVSEAGLVGLMERHGLIILLAELIVLAVLTVAAIGSDEFWTRRFEAARSRSNRDAPEQGE
jgi:hypothetical protein